MVKTVQIHCYQRQSGFREHHSRQTALLKIIDDWLTAIDKNMVSGSLFIDLSQAFDLVNPKPLIDKLQLYNIDTIYFLVYIYDLPISLVQIYFLMIHLSEHNINMLRMSFNPLLLGFKMFFLGV